MIRQDLVINQEEREAFIELLIELNDRYKKSQKIYKIVAFVGLLFGIFFFVCGSIVVPIVFVFHFIFFFYMSKKGLKKKMEKSIQKEFPEDGTLIRTYTISDEGISLRSRYGFDLYPWDVIIKAGKYYHYYYFYRSDGQVMLIDHRMLEDAQKEEVLTYIKKVEDAYGTKRK